MYRGAGSEPIPFNWRIKLQRDSCEISGKIKWRWQRRRKVGDLKLSNRIAIQRDAAVKCDSLISQKQEQRYKPYFQSEEMNMN